MISPSLARPWLGRLIVLVALVGLPGPANAQVPYRGNLVVTGSVSPNPGPSGGQITYTATVTNDSTVTALGVRVGMTLPTGPDFIRCTPSVSVPCTLAAGVLTATFPSIAAHTAITVRVIERLPGVDQTTSFPLVVTADAGGAINGEKPRHGDATIVATAVSNLISVTLLPSRRTDVISCGATIDSTFFQPGETTVQLGASMGCVQSPVALRIAASGKTFDLNKFKIVGASTNQVRGSVAIVIAAGTTGVTIAGGSTRSSSGIEFFDYCVKDEAGASGITLTNLRCFRNRSVGIDLVSNGVQLNTVLVDLVAGGTATTTAELPGGIGIHASGDVHIKDTIVRRTTQIGIWLDGAVDTNADHRVGLVDGTTATSRVEVTSGVGILLDGAFQVLKNTYVAGDGDDGLSTTGVWVRGYGVLIDSLEVSDFGGVGFVVNGDAASIYRSTVESVGGDSFAVTGANVKLSGNGASLNLRGFVVSGPGATLDTNVVEKAGDVGFLVTGDHAVMTGNSAKSGSKGGFVLTGSGGSYNTNKAETNNGTGFTIAGNNGFFKLNSAKGQKLGNGFLITGSGNTFDTNSAEKNKDAEWVIAPGNVAVSNTNKKNGKTFTFGAASSSFE
jgi:uncharacterized repeat protein (TIGR01451 family)